MNSLHVAGAHELADSPRGSYRRSPGYFGRAYAIVFPWSEAAMYCKIAGKPMVAVVEPNGVYLLSRDGARGAHFTHGEAGVFIRGYENDLGFGKGDFLADRWGVEMQISAA